MNEIKEKQIVVDASTQTYLKSNGLDLIFKFLRHNSNLFKYFRKQTKFSKQNSTYNLFTLHSVHNELFENSLIKNDVKKLLNQNFNENQALDHFSERKIEKSRFDTKSVQTQLQHSRTTKLTLHK